MHSDALLAIAEDLEYLSTWGGEISNGEIRRGTAILRRLLVEDSYGAAWRAIGQVKQPSLVAVDLQALLGNSASVGAYALAGGAFFRGVKIAGMVISSGGAHLGGTPLEPIRADGFPFERNFTLSEFLSSLSGISDGRPFNRREVIRYLANVKGGVHLSPKLRKQEEKLVARLGKCERKISVHNTDGLFVEAVAYAQSLGNSEDAQFFVRKIREMVY